MSRVRVSASGLARIGLDDKLLVELKTKNERYSPFGGALRFEESAKPFLLSLGAEFERGNDLRLTLPEGNVKIFDWWVRLRKNRETSVYRELVEELVNEQQVLEKLPESDVRIEYLFTKSEEGNTDKPSEQGLVTKRYFEVYQTIFTPEYKQIIREVLGKEGSGLGLVSYDEVRNKRASCGVRIANHCSALLVD